MTEIWPKYVAQAFLPHPLNRQLRTPLDRVNHTDPQDHVCFLSRFRKQIIDFLSIDLKSKIIWKVEYEIKLQSF